MTDFPKSFASPGGCQGCRNKGVPEMDFAFAFQPIVDLRDQTTFAHEALVRGVNGEGALSVLERWTIRTVIDSINCVECGRFPRRLTWA